VLVSLLEQDRVARLGVIGRIEVLEYDDGEPDD
jgi:hypothetical protein